MEVLRPHRLTLAYSDRFRRFSTCRRSQSAPRNGHQSNARIIESAIEKLNLPREKVLVNIDRYGNTSAGSVGLCLDELNRAGKTPDGKPFIMVAFGGGLTWASCVWNK